MSDEKTSSRGGQGKRVCLDLFSGLGGFSQAFEESEEWDVVTVDINDEFEPDICADILEFGPEDLPDPDLVLASPPCPDFSVACIVDKWDHDERRRPRHLPEKQSIADSVKIVFHTLWIVRELDPEWWYMENPEGMLQKWIGEPSGTVHYCQYGSDFKKPTDLWGLHPPNMAYKKCQNRPECHISNPRDVNTFRDESRTRAVDSSNSAERAKVPKGLSEAIMRTVDNAEPAPEPPEQSSLNELNS